MKMALALFKLLAIMVVLGAIVGVMIATMVKTYQVLM